MKENFRSLLEKFALFEKDASSCVFKGSRRAGIRARQLSIEIEKLLLEFRKKSISAYKDKPKEPMTEEKKKELAHRLSLHKKDSTNEPRTK